MGCCSLLVLATLFFQLQHILTIPISMEDATCSDKKAVIETLHRIADSVLLDYKSMAPSWSPAFFQKHLAIVSSPHSSTTERKMYSRGLATENDTSWKQDTGVVLYDAHLKTFLERFTSDDDLMKTLFNGFYRLIGSSSYYNGSSELRRSIAESEVELHCSGDEPSPQTAGLCTGAVKNLFQLSEIVQDKLETYPGQLRHAVHHSEPMFMNDLPSEERLNAATVVAQKHTTDSEAAIQKAIVEMMDLYDDEKENFLENFPEHRHAGRILFDHSFKLINSHRFHKEKKPRQKRMLRRTVNNLCPSFTDNQADL